MICISNNAVFSSILMPLIGNLMFLLVSCSKYSYSFQPAIVTPNINSCAEICRLSSCRINFRAEFSFTSLSVSDSNSEIGSTFIPFDGNEDRFERWRFLQEFLEGDHPSSDVVNIVLYRVLEGVLKYPRPSGGSETLGSDDTVEMTTEERQQIEKILADYSTEGRVNAVMTMSNDDDDFEKGEIMALETLEQLENVLPDPVEYEDDYKSLWDTVIQLHGREAVKFNESQKLVSLDWKIANTVTRVLLHFDFLTYGIIDAPL